MPLGCLPEGSSYITAQFKTFPQSVRMYQIMKRNTLISISILMLVSGAFLIARSFRNSVILTTNGTDQAYSTFSNDVQGFLENIDFPTTEYDFINLPSDAALEDGTHIIIEQASTITLTIGQQETIIHSIERIPTNILREAGIKLLPEDKVFLDGKQINPESELNFRENLDLAVSQAVEITLEDDTETLIFYTHATILGEALEQEGIQLQKDDILEPDEAFQLSGGTLGARIKRAKEIKLTIDGNTTRHITNEFTVGEALASAGYPLQGLDYTIPDSNQKIPINGEIKLIRVTEEYVIEQEPISFDTNSQPLADLELDQRSIIQVGEYGITAKSIRVVYEDQVEVSRQTEDKWIAKEPVSRIIGYGTNIVPRTVSTADGKINYWRAIEAYASSYSPCRSAADRCYPNTSSGKPVVKGVIAVTLSWYLYMKGMPVYIPGYGYATVEDVGGGIPGQYWVDLGYSDEDWVGWGQYVTVYFLTPVPSPDNIMWVLD